ncbi:MAG: gamma-glutamylputrescine oxidase, partial [Granulosicoccus sp.]
MIQRTPHTGSYYAATRNDTQERAILSDSIDADVCIVGAGFTGISSALHLAEAGYKVVVLEAARIGFGASGRNGGQLVNSYSRDLDVIEKNYGPDLAQMLGAMAFEGGRIIRERISQYDIQCDFKPGGIYAALNQKQMHELQEQKALWERFGHEGLTLLDQAAIRKEIASEAYVGGLFDATGGHIQPLNLLLGEVAAFEGLGGQVFEDSKVIEIERSVRPLVKTAQ